MRDEPPPPPPPAYAPPPLPTYPPASPPLTPPQPVGARNSALSVISFSAGLLALLLALVPLYRPAIHLTGLAVAVAAIICGHVAYGRREPWRGFAVAGFTLGYVAIGIEIARFLGGVLLRVARLRRGR